MNISCLLIEEFISLNFGLLYSYKINNYANPIICFFLPQFLSHSLFAIVYSDFQLSNTTIWAYLLGHLGFLFFYFALVCFCPQIPQKSMNYYVFNKKIDACYKIIGLCALILGGYVAIKRGMDSFGPAFFFAIRANASIGKYSIPYVDHFILIVQVMFYIYVYRFFIQKEKNVLIQMIFLLFCMFVKFFYCFSKTDILAIVSYMSYIYYLSIKEVVKIQKLLFALCKILLIFIGLLFLTTCLRHDFIQVLNSFNSREFFLYKYLSYPIACFDINISNSYVSGDGYYSLCGLGKVLAKAGVFQERNTNAYSYMDKEALDEFNVGGFCVNPYLDFGLLGCFVIPAFIAVICFIIFQLSLKRKGLCMIFYAAYIQSILLSFFSFQYFNGIYVWIILFLIPIFVFSKKIIVYDYTR